MDHVKIQVHDVISSWLCSLYACMHRYV